MVEKIDLFNGLDLTNWEKTDYAGKGEVRVDDNGSLILEMGAELSGIRWNGDKQLPTINYQVLFRQCVRWEAIFFVALLFHFTILMPL